MKLTFELVITGAGVVALVNCSGRALTSICETLGFIPRNTHTQNDG